MIFYYQFINPDEGIFLCSLSTNSKHLSHTSTNTEHLSHPLITDKYKKYITLRIFIIAIYTEQLFTTKTFINLPTSLGVLNYQFECRQVGGNINVLICLCIIIGTQVIVEESALLNQEIKDQVRPFMGFMTFMYAYRLVLIYK